MVSPRVRSRKLDGRRVGMWAAGAALCGLMLLGWLHGGHTVELYGQARRALEATSGGVQVAWNFFLAHPYFAIREVKVLGVEKVKGADIVVMSGLGPHTRIWSIDPVELEERVRRHPWVKSVLIRRELPARLVITIEEWTPGAIVALDKLYYVADDGVIFKALDEEDSVDFPFITGLRAAELPPEEPGTREKLSEAVIFGRAVERTALGLSEIRFQPGGGHRPLSGVLPGAVPYGLGRLGREAEPVGVVPGGVPGKGGPFPGRRPELPGAGGGAPTRKGVIGWT